MISIFISETCPNCPRAKDWGKTMQEKGEEVIYYDVNTIDGRAEALYNDILSTPSVIMKDGTILRGCIPNNS
jgi:hypothetical protein